MKKEFAKKIKELFDFQKFEENPKLNQVIEDSFKDNSFKISDLELTEILGGKSDYFMTKCPSCHRANTLVVYIQDGTRHEACLSCHYSK